MRMHIVLDDELVARIDAIAGPRGRTQFVREAIVRSLDHQSRWDKIEAAFGTISAAGHDWDADPAGWVRDERRSDRQRVG